MPENTPIEKPLNSSEFSLPGVSIPKSRISWIFQRYLPILISLTILVIVFSLVDLQLVYIQLKKSNKLLMLFAFSLTLPQLALRAYRWRYLMTLQKIECSFKAAALYYVASMYIGMITPGRMGELSKALFLKANNITSFSKAMSSVLVDRLLDAFALLAFVIIAAWQTKFFGLVSFQWSYLFAALALFLLVCFSPKLLQVFARRVGTGLLRKSSRNWVLMIDEFTEGIGQLLRPRLLVAVMITLLHYGIFFFQADLIAQAVGINVPFFVIFTVVTIATLIGFIPISAAGIGTRDAAFIFLFKAVGVAKTTGLGFAVAFDIVCLVGTSIIGMIACWFIPFNVRNLINKNRKSCNLPDED